MLTYLDTAIGIIVVMLAISLLITIATQAVSALLNHRGGNLRWGLETLFANVDPTLKVLAQNAGPLSGDVLRHSLISDSWLSENPFGRLALRIPILRSLVRNTQLASAIRPTELTLVLRQIAATLPALPEPVPAGFVVTALHQYRLDLESLLGTVSGSASRLEVWFGSMMDRVSQRFTTWMRLWTVVFAFGFAFSTGLDTVGLAMRIYQSSALRDSLVAAAQQVSGSAAAVLDPQNSLSARYTAALVSALQAQSLAVPNPAPVIRTVADGTQWINGNVAAAKLPAVLQFDNAAQTATRSFLADNRDAAAKLIQSNLGTEILRQFHWPARFFQWTHWPADFGKAAAWRLNYLLRVLVTAALLSLGAPFWFNSLKSLANLRPIMASKADQEGA
jgi:hypothetical protein